LTVVVGIGGTPTPHGIHLLRGVEAMMKVGSAKITNENKWLFLANGYWIIAFSWILAPAMLLFVLTTSLWTIVVGRSPFDGQQMALAYPKWEAVGIILLIFAPVALLLFFLGRFGKRYVATVKAGKLPWPWPAN
jgi:hypothetical protein